MNKKSKTGEVPELSHCWVYPPKGVILEEVIWEGDPEVTMDGKLDNENAIFPNKYGLRKD